jgi:predicted transcriptional regulator
MVEAMHKHIKWFLAMSVATMITANGIVMAAVAPEQPDSHDTQRSVFAAITQFVEAGDNKALLELLKVDAETLKSEMKAGKSLAAIANEHGISEKTLKDFILAQVNRQVEAGIQSGRIDVDKVAQVRAEVEQRITDIINNRGLIFNPDSVFISGQKLDNTKLLELLNIDAEALQAEINAGRTLVSIANEQGISEKTLKEFIVQQVKQYLEEGVASGRISADMVEQMKANMEQRISEMINAKGLLSKR